MRRRDFIKGIGGSAAAWPVRARAQQPALPVVALVTLRSAEASLRDNGGQDTVSDDELNKFIAELNATSADQPPSADQQRITNLEGTISNLRAAETQRQSREDFDKFSSHLQGQLGPNVDESFARTNLLAMVAQKPELEIAWSFRNLTNAQLKAADLEFRQLEALYNRTQQAPDDPRKAEALRQMERRGQELGLMMNARTMIANARRDVLNRARIAQPPIDLEMTALRDDIAWAMRGSSHGDIPEPPVNWGRLSNKEFREKVIRDHGFDPGG